jgi:hypothetical protein
MTKRKRKKQNDQHEIDRKEIKWTNEQTSKEQEDEEKLRRMFWF